MLQLITAVLVGAFSSYTAISFFIIKNHRHMATKQEFIDLRDAIKFYLDNINGDISTLLNKIDSLQKTLDELLEENNLSAGEESDVFKAFSDLKAFAQQIAGRVPELPEAPPTDGENNSESGSENAEGDTGKDGQESADTSGESGSDAESEGSEA